MNIEKIQEQKIKRFEFIQQIYETTKGNSNTPISLDEIRNKLNVGIKESEQVIKYLQDEGLIEFIADPNVYIITHYGIKEFETALSKPNESTQYFPPIINVMNVTNMNNSNIQQGAVYSTQNTIVSTDIQNDISEFIKLLESSLSTIGIGDDKRDELQRDIDTVKIQVKSKQPYLGILKESLASIQRILEGVSSNVAASQLLLHLPKLLSLLENVQIPGF